MIRLYKKISLTITLLISLRVAADTLKEKVSFFSRPDFSSLDADINLNSDFFYIWSDPSQSTRRDWAPLIYVDFNITDKLVSQDQFEGNDQLNLPLAREQKGYVLTRGYELNIGSGIASTWQWNYSNFLSNYLKLYIGVLPVAGKKVEATYFIQNKEAAQKISPKEIPQQAADLNSWNKGESLQYATTGGLLLSAGPAFGPLASGVGVMASGTWETTIKKVDASKVFVTYKKSNLKSLSLIQDAGLASLSLSVFKNLEQSFSYIIDLSDESALKVYKDFIKGSLIPAQEMSAHQSPFVEAVLKTRATSRGRMNSLTVGIPILLNTSFNFGKVHTQSQTEYLQDGTEVESEYGIYVRNQQSRFFMNKSGEGVVFYGAAEKTTDAQGNEKNSISADFIWNYEDTSAQAYELCDALKSLVRLTGLTKEVKVGFEKSTEPWTELGYVSAKVRMKLNEATSEMLLKWSRATSAEKELLNRTLALAQSYFKNGDANEICVHENEALSSCQSRFESDIKDAVRGMLSALRKMNKFRENKKSFVEAYAEFGKAMLETPFTFQALLEWSKPHGASLAYQLEGESVPHVARLYQWSF